MKELTPNDTLVIFEGIDKVGKTTLINAFHKKTNYSYITVDRGPISFKTYNKMKNRNNDLTYNLISDIVPALYVCVVADLDDIIQRFKDTNETDLEISEIGPYLHEFYNQAFTFKPNKWSKKILVNTSINSVDECVKIIINNLTKED